MKIEQIEVSQIRGCTYALIKPRKAGVTVIGGLNSQGKSSCLDGVSMAIGGKKLFPDSPIQSGSQEGYVNMIVDGDCEALPWPCEIQRTVQRGEDGESYTTKLRIVTEDQSEAPEPQTLLKRILTKDQLEFDPIAFVDAKATVQADIVKRLVGLDFTQLDAQRTKLYAERTGVNRSLRDAEGELVKMPLPDNQPSGRIDPQKLIDDLAQAERHNTTTTGAKATSESLTIQMRAIRDQETARLVAHEQMGLKLEQDLEAKINLLQEEHEAAIARAKITAEEDRQKLADRISELASLQIQAEYVSKQDMIDTAAIREQLASANATNQAFDLVEQRIARLTIKNRYAGDSKRLTSAIKQIDKKKTELTKAANWPIEGLGFGDDGLVYNGHTLADLASSEQLRISVAIAAGLQSDFRFVIVRNGSLLDDDSLAALDNIATDLDVQLLVERVSSGRECHYVFEQGKAVSMADSMREETTNGE